MMEVKKCVCGKARPSYALPGVAEATHCARYHYNLYTVVNWEQFVSSALCGTFMDEPKHCFAVMVSG